MAILKLQPVFKDVIWGGSLLREFGYKEASDKAGECWGISAHKSGDCTILNGECNLDYFSHMVEYINLVTNNFYEF